MKAKKAKTVSVLAALVLLILVSAGQAAPITYMDATTHNGSLTPASSSGFWYNTPGAIPAEWEETNNYMYTAALHIETGTNGEAICNTGEQVIGGHAYTIQADLGGWTGTTNALAAVRVYATENSDGSGATALITQLTREATDASGYTLYTVSSTGTGVSASLDGYYVQVKIGDSSGTYFGGFYDNIVVTSEVATSMTYMNASLHNGSLTPASSTGFWYNTPGAIPDEWEETNIYMYTAPLLIQTGTAGEAICNTGEQVIGGHAYTIQADLGGWTGTTNAVAAVRVYATKNADGTGAKALLAQLTREATDPSGYTLYTVSNTGAGISTSLSGYYLQVKIGDLNGAYPGGFYDNIVVTSEEATPEPTTITYMDAVLHNGSFSDASVGFWYNTPAAIPDEWEETNIYMYTAGATTFLQTGTLGEAICNTGEQVIGGHAYTIQADLGGWTGTTNAVAAVRVYATKNADGTGAKALLAQLTREATDPSGYNLYTVSDTGAGISTSLAGYYLQVKIGDLNGAYPGGFYDNIVVTSEEATPEPTTITYMDALLHNGSLTANATGFWANPSAIPAGWDGSATNYTTATMFTQLGTGGQAINNTGETVPVSEAFTVSADLGGSDDTLPTVRVYATENSDGTGAKVLLAEVSRPGDNGDGYDLFTVSATGNTTPPSVEGYYVQVVLDGGGYYDNIVVTSELSAEPPTIIYMDAFFNNGAMNATSTGYWDDPDAIPFDGWASTDDPNTYTATTRFILFSSIVEAVTNNTGETVPVNHRFTIQADLGGDTGATAQAAVYATENIDGTGTKVLLAQVSRPGNDADNYDLFTVSGTGAPTDVSVEGYYVQVLLKTIAGDPNFMGYYDNIVVTSKEAVSIPSKTYMDEDLHNGALTATSSGYWTSPDSLPFGGWSAADPNGAYTTSTMFTAADSSAGEIINNTQETVIGNHQFTVQADLGGVTGATAEVLVYATENWDGTGTKVLLTQVSRAGNDADGLTLFTVSATGSTVLPSLDGYYVQVMLKTTGAVGLDAYYDTIIVTSSEPTCGDAGHPYPIGDLSQDCYVDLQDFAIFAGEWMANDCVDPGWCNGADLNFMDGVNLQDFVILVDNWLACTDPGSPCSYNP